MKTFCKVSIILPSLNVAEYIEESLRSVVNQTLKDIEIICVDAGSTDGTYEILQKFAEKDSRVKVIRSEYKSYGYQVNIGITAATGEYIGVVETDDYVDHEMYAKLYQHANSKKLDVVKADFHFFYGKEKKREFVYGSLLNRNISHIYGKITNAEDEPRILDADMVTWAGIYQRSFLVNNEILHNETPGASFQDNGFWIQIMLYAKRILFINEPFYFLRRDNEKSSVFARNKINCMSDEYDFMRKMILKRGIDTEKWLLYLWVRRYNAAFSEIRRARYYDRVSAISIISRQLRNAIDRGELFFSPENEQLWDQILELAERPDDYFHKYYEVDPEVKKMITKADHIYIYGAGNYAMKTFSMINGIEGFDDSFKGFIVSDTEGNPVRLCYKKVFQMDSIILDDKTLVIIGVSQKFKTEIKELLSQKGIYNTITYDDLHVK